ncbi:hypothetical protein R5W24_000209 [Gemmata sp. JC717]|uniref:hypothetical protein n=1 Tax=Gemmata algarum TaxID=2975278 RepID=UPI0021BAFE09|nr:hypothetical protein [Gemmata algarum]MDY3551135.1 hypothetical protein [Gemmata algarum]
MKLLTVAVTLVAFAVTGRAEDKKAQPPVTLELVAKNDKYKFDGSGKAPAEFKKYLEEIAQAQKDGKLARPPQPPAVELVLKFTNTTKNDTTIYVGGDSNSYTFDLTGGSGSVAVGSGRAFTEEFRFPKAVTLAPGKSHEIPVKQLADGHRGASRYVYWTGPGEYKLSAKYVLANADGSKGAELASEPITITVGK